ncbi:hypothetical protein C4J81_01675 [Deltaproteobacteria bacterium Smac51]|nr:hypothetical protein C4J81_01675 [Deltaproteobacteria bacterium Smac51]
MKRCIILIAAALLTTACGGPLPPVDPPNLSGAKDALSRGNYWYERGCFLEAEKFFQEGLGAARLSDDVLLMVRAQNSMGTAALARGDLGLAAGLLEQALDMSTATSDEPELDKIMGNLGSLAFKAGQAADAEEFWLNAVQLAEGKGASPAIHLCNLARLYLNQGRPEFPALSARALAAAQAGADLTAKADAYNLAGHAALNAGDEAQADTYFQQALEMDRKTENTIGLAQDTESLGRLRQRQNQLQEAAGFLDRSFFLWAAAGDHVSRDRVYALLKELSRSAGFPKKMTPYDQARKHPSDFSLSSQCP